MYIKANKTKFYSFLSSVSPYPLPARRLCDFHSSLGTAFLDFTYEADTVRALLSSYLGKPILVFTNPDCASVRWELIDITVDSLRQFGLLEG